MGRRRPMGVQVLILFPHVANSCPLPLVSAQGGPPSWLWGLNLLREGMSLREGMIVILGWQRKHTKIQARRAYVSSEPNTSGHFARQIMLRLLQRVACSAFRWQAP
jgi:hypothetical protein